MKRYVLVICLVGWTYMAFSQVINLQSICDNNHKCPITTFTSTLIIDTQIPIDSIVNTSLRHQFLPPGKKIIQYDGYVDNYYWFRFIVHNPDSQPSEQRLMIGPFGMRDARLYQKNNGTWGQVAVAGLVHSFRERSYPFAHHVLPVTIPAGSTDTLYMSMDSHHSYTLYGFSLLPQKEMLIFANRLYFRFGIIIGILALFCIFNLYLYFSIRDRIHLYYSLYIGMLILFVMRNDQFDQQFLGWDNEALYRMITIMPLGALVIGVLMHVVQMYLVNIPRSGLMYKLALVAKINVLTSGVVHLVTYNLKPGISIESLAFYWANISTQICIAVIIANCIYSIKRGFKSAWFILAAMVVFLVGSIQRLMLTSYIALLYPPSLFHIGMVTETLIISFGLIYRYRVDRKEKEQYLKEKVELKNNFDKILLESKFEIQEQTLKNISEEIHDNIGQVLSLVKLNLTSHVPLASNDLGKKNTNNEDSISLLTKAIGDLRSLSKSLDTGYVMDMGLIKSIGYELDQLKKAGGFETHLAVKGDPWKLETQTELILFRMFQEILNNIIKHSKASRVTVELLFAEHHLAMKVADNGIGFKVDQKKTDGLGVRNLNNRAKLLGATLNITSNHSGTTIAIDIPNIVIVKGN